MEVFSVALLLISYSFGLATLIIQIICCLRDLEYKETVFFTTSFLLLIVFLTIPGIFKVTDPDAIYIQELFINYAVILFGVSVPVNIHKERTIKYRPLRNTLFITTGTIVAILITILFLKKNPNMTLIYISSAFIFLSVFYTIIHILITKPEALIRPNERNERVMAVFILIIMTISLITFVSIGHERTNIILSRKGINVVALFGMIMSIFKIPVDIKKLTAKNDTLILEEEKIHEMGISQHEKEIMTLLISGKKFSEIAVQLNFSLSTVKTHVSNIYSKAKVRNRLELSNLLRNTRS